MSSDQETSILFAPHVPKLTQRCVQLPWSQQHAIHICVDVETRDMFFRGAVVLKQLLKEDAP